MTRLCLCKYASCRPIVLFWRDHWVTNVCLCALVCARSLSAATHTRQQHKPPLPPSNGAQTISMSGPELLLIHSLIDNLCSRLCMVPFTFVCLCAPSERQYCSCNSRVTICLLRYCLWLGDVCVCVCGWQMQQNLLTGNQPGQSITSGHNHKVTHTRKEWRVIIRVTQACVSLWLRRRSCQYKS